MTGFTEFKAKGSRSIVFGDLSGVSVKRNLFLTTLKHQNDLSRLPGHEFCISDQSSTMGEVRHLSLIDFTFPGHRAGNRGLQAPEPAVLLGFHSLTMIESRPAINTHL